MDDLNIDEPLDTVADLDAALLRPCSLERRAELMTRRITLDQAQRAVPPRAEPLTGFTIRVPTHLPISDIVDQSGRRFQTRMVGDRVVIDVTPAVFQILLAGPDGKHWSDANQDSNVWERMQPGLH